LGFIVAIALIPVGYAVVLGVQRGEIFLMLTLFAPVLKSSPLNPIPPELDLTLLFYILFLIVTGLLFLFRKRTLPQLEMIDIPLIIFTLIVFVEYFNAPAHAHEYALTKLLRYLFFALPFFYFPRILIKVDFYRLNRIITILGSGICLSLFIIYPNSYVMKSSGNTYLTVAAIAGIAMLFSASNFVQEPRKYWKLLYLGCMTADILLAFKTNSRGGILFSGLVVVVYFMIVFRTKHLLALFSMIFLTLITILTYILFPDFFTRFFFLFKQHKGPSLSTRFVVYKLALKLISQRWFTGIGLGGFSNYHFLKYPHNLILEIFVEHGIAGFLAFLGILFGVVSKGISAVRRRAISPTRVPYLLAALFMFLFHMSSFGLESTRLLFFFGGCLVTFSSTSTENVPEISHEHSK